MLDNIKIGMIGLGYVGLPLAVEFGRKYPTVGFDINRHRIEELRAGRDHTLEVSEEELAAATKLTYSADLQDIADCSVYIVTVPTPINEHKQPDLTPLQKASDLLGKVIKRGDIVIYESTVYPGATEEVCVPILEKVSGLKFNQDFYVAIAPSELIPATNSIG
nr:NAD(P)-binding domain-containing protein [Methylomonas koyamae]